MKVFSRRSLHLSDRLFDCWRTTPNYFCLCFFACVLARKPLILNPKWVRIPRESETDRPWPRDRFDWKTIAANRFWESRHPPPPAYESDDDLTCLDLAPLNRGQYLVIEPADVEPLDALAIGASPISLSLISSSSSQTPKPESGISWSVSNCVRNPDVVMRKDLYSLPTVFPCQLSNVVLHPPPSISSACEGVWSRLPITAEKMAIFPYLDSSFPWGTEWTSTVFVSPLQRELATSNSLKAISRSGVGTIAHLETIDFCTYKNPHLNGEGRFQSLFWRESHDVEKLDWLGCMVTTY